MEKIILDASALIALIYEEKGKELVEQHMAHAQMSTVNLAEVASYMIKKGLNPHEVSELLRDLSLEIMAFDESHALLAAELITKTAEKGLSLGDRACLALALSQKHPILTADRAWASLPLKAKVILIR